MQNEPVTDGYADADAAEIKRIQDAYGIVRS